MPRRKEFKPYTEHRFPKSNAQKERDRKKIVRDNYARMQALKDLTISIKKENGCYICKENAECCLSFHHIDPETKEFDISSGIRQRISKKRILIEIEKCIVLCENCHRKLHAGLVTLEK